MSVPRRWSPFTSNARFQTDRFYAGTAGSVVPASLCGRGRDWLDRIKQSGKKVKKKPLFGVDNWLVVGAVFRKTYAAKTIPSSILRGIGTIVDKPPGIEQFKIDAPASMQSPLRVCGQALSRRAFPVRRKSGPG